MPKLKVMTFEAFHFLLPEDFDGDLTDALEEYVKYRKRTDRPKGVTRDYPPEDDKMLVGEFRKKVFDEFYDAIGDGFRASGAVCLREYDFDEKRWNDYPYDKEKGRDD